MLFVQRVCNQIPIDSNDKEVAAMLDELTIEAYEESFVIVLQHGGNDVTATPLFLFTMGTLN